MTRSPLFWLLLAATGVASYPVFKVEGHQNAQSDMGRKGRVESGGDRQDNQGDVGTNRGIGKQVRTTVMRVSAYDADCGICCGEYSTTPVRSGKRQTASGHIITPADYGRIVAAPRSIPFGTKLRIEGIGIVDVQDRGGYIREAGDTVAGKVLRYPRIDLLCSSHNEAREFGVKYLPVTIYEGK